MNNLRFHDAYLNSVLVTLIDPSDVIVFVKKFRDSRVVVNIASFIESQCQCNILSKGLGIDKELFTSGRKFLHSVMEGTDYCKLPTAQKEFKQLGIIFKREIAFLNLFLVSQFDDSVHILPTMPLKVFEFCAEYKGEPISGKSKLCIKPSKFITVVHGSVEIVDYLQENPYEIEMILQYIMRYAGSLQFLVDYCKIYKLFMERSNPVVLHAFVDLYFCMYEELIWRENNGL